MTWLSPLLLVAIAVGPDGAETIKEIRKEHRPGVPAAIYQVRVDTSGAEVWHGSYATFHENGKPRERGQYRDGERDGEWEVLFQNGVKAEQGRYDRGFRVGEWTFRDGADRKDGKRCGNYVLDERKDGEGRPVERGSKLGGVRVEHWELLYPNGAVLARMQYGPTGGPRVFEPEIFLADGRVDPAMGQSGAPQGMGAGAASGPGAADLALPAFAPPLDVGAAEAARFEQLAGAAADVTSDGASDAIEELRAAGARALYAPVNRLMALAAAEPANAMPLARFQGGVLRPLARDWGLPIRREDDPQSAAARRLVVLRWAALAALGAAEESRAEVDRLLAYECRFTAAAELEPESVLRTLTARLSGAATAAKAGVQQRSRPAQLAVRAAQGWLVRHQDPKGYFSAEGFSGQCATGRCGGNGEADLDLLVTSLAVEALLLGPDDGDDPAAPARRDAALSGLCYLLAVQDRASGAFGAAPARRGGAFPYGPVSQAAHAANALAAGAREFDSAALRAAVQRTVNYLMSAKNPYSAWSEAFPPDATKRLETTCASVLALTAAADLGSESAKEDCSSARVFLEELTDPDSGRVGQEQSGARPLRERGTAERWPPERSEFGTALAMFARLRLGTMPWSSELRAGADLLLNCLPRWDEEAGGIDYGYWHAGALAMYQMGGQDWNRWNSSLLDAVVQSQRRDGCEAGSWDPEVDPFGSRGGRVYATATLALALAPDRYARVRPPYGR